MTWRIYLRAHQGGAVTDKTNTSDPVAAEAAYRALLARDDLAGQPLAAVLSSTVTGHTGGGTSIYFSRFDKDYGEGRIHHDAPLDLFRDGDGTDEATAWRPPAGIHDWETDPQSFAECLKGWHGRPGWTRDRAAAELRVPRRSYDGWCNGRPCEREMSMRRFMTLIDQSTR